VRHLAEHYLQEADRQLRAEYDDLDDDYTAGILFTRCVSLIHADTTIDGQLFPLIRRAVLEEFAENPDA